MKMNNLLKLGVFAASLNLVNATVLFSESPGINLSNNPSFASPLGMTVIGENIVSGTINENGTFQPDVFSITVPADQQLVEFTISNLSSTGTNHFLLLDDDLIIDSSSNTPEALFATLVNDSNLSENLLLTGGGNEFSATESFTLPLGAGNYAIWFQETSNETVDYSFSFTTEAIPEPSVSALSILSIIFCFSLRKRRSY